MTAPAWRAAGTAQAGVGAVTPGMPAGVLTDDILLLFIETSDEAITVSGGTETWTEVADSPVSMTVTTPTRLTVFWARASQNSPTSPTTSDSGDHQLAVIAAFSGCITSGDPWDVTSPGTDSTSNTSFAVPGDTTTVADCLVVAVATADFQNAYGNTWTNADLTSVTERIDTTTSVGNRGSIGVATGVKAAAGAYGTTTGTLTANSRKAMMSIALRPPTAAQIISVGQASETDTGQAITGRKTQAVAQATETDTAQTITPTGAIVVNVDFAVEFDEAQDVTSSQPHLIGQAVEADRAEQIAVIGGQLVVSDVPVLIRAPAKAGRIFHEIELRGDTYHPNIAGWVAEEEAPGGFGPSRGRISERIFRAHRDVIRAGANWYVFHEDGTCLHAGRLLEPDASEGEVQLVDRGVASLADREIGPVLYQAAVGDQFATMSGQSRKWSTSFGRMSHTHVDAGILWTRQSTPGDTGVDNGPQVVIPMFGRELVFLRAHVQGTKAQLVIYTSQKQLLADIESSAELDLASQFENYFLTFAPTTGVSSGEIEVDLTLGGNALTVPNDELTNVADEGTAGTGFVYPEVVILEVGDDGEGSEANRENATEVLVSNLEINGVPVGERNRFSASDLVADVASLIGIRFTQIEGGSFDILPYELPAGTPASEPLDYASLLTGKRARILHNGRRAVLEFGSWSENVWGLASPWSPFDAIPQDRYDAVAVPFYYGTTQLDDQVIVKLDDSPLDRRNIYWGLTLSDPVHAGDKARALGALVAEELVRKRNAGSFAAAEVLDRNGVAVSAHKVNAGDTINPLRKHEPGRTRISHLSRYEDHVEGTFDGGNHALERMLARREKRMSRR